MRAVTLLGMSGAGKTHFSQKLEYWNWVHYSNDLEIAKRLEIDVKVDDLSALSAFIGQLGDEAKGGLPLDEFRERQRMYYEAECAVLRDMEQAMHGGESFVNDSTGSFCEITDEILIEDIAHKTLLVYIETDEADHADVIKRAQEYPKPLYFPPALFDEWVEEFCDLQGVSVERMVPNEFSAWVFPKLFTSRLPKYERLAVQYGVKISARDLHACEDEGMFLRLIDER